MIKSILQLGAGLVIAFISFTLVKLLMGQIYSILGRPFSGDIIAGSMYSFAVGLFSALCCYLVISKLFNRNIAYKTLLLAGGAYLFYFLYYVFTGLSKPETTINFVHGIPTYLMLISWFILALLVRKKAIEL